MDASVRDGSDLSADKIATLVAIERTGASLSMIAIALIATSYLVYPKLRTTPNTFLLFASIANAGASIASMIGHDGMMQGDDSSLCQGQAFIFEWFMQADPWWSCAMACNVFLVFFCNVDPTAFPRYIWAYCIVCFGGPLIPAVTLISMKDRSRGPVFGDATMLTREAQLWCWIGPNWSLVRLYAYYIPIWICIFLSIVIYIAVGYHVFQQRNRLRSAGLQSLDKSGCLQSVQTTDVEDSAEEMMFSERIDCYGIAVTEVQVESDASPCDDRGQLILQPPTHVATISTSANNMVETTQTLHRMESATRTSVSVSPSAAARANKTSLSHQLSRLRQMATTRLRRLDPVKMAYLRTSFIFGFTVLVTWIPSSVNRLYSIANHGHINFQLSAVSGTVLPLQGVMNALIYFTTSWDTVRQIRRGIADTIFRRRSSAAARYSGGGRRRRSRSRGFGAALHGRTSNISQDRRRQGMRLEELEMEPRLPDSARLQGV
ncbi:GPCR, family 2, secretin-like protein [Cordyceps fumosorosea ARSEF 2679]|uniref:GPCR, family 2, secretin-like protein n=1 Tax=Cordyceps fumosorosea (strain ARSEF 2679) TaxID=1081104 RepID=A0A168CAV7_CORFA|nr:GPCR, family 2, secretin-like protein [Cordyceps fumosorosea ARSEF 2679]OAA71166.1 GPCR, family 2, secretin-like protein [Cordyceps fumosorosea ARSEF 2679]